MCAHRHSPDRNLRKWLKNFPRLRIGVLGDYAADHYLIGQTSRISREAPVLILKKSEESVRPGQAGNSAANLAALDIGTHAFGFIGDDREGAMLRAELESRGVETSGLLTLSRRSTIKKTRVLAGAHHTALQQVIRLDDDEGLDPSTADQRRLKRLLFDRLPELDALLISDYGYGALTLALWKALAGPGGGKRKAAAPVPRILDSRFGLSRYKGADVITPNETEVFSHLGIEHFAGADPESAGRRLIEKTGCGGLIMTRGNEGMLIFGPDSSKPTQIPIFGSDEVTDVTGAGDTVSAVAAAVTAAGGPLVEAGRLANVAAGLVVMKLGAATVSRDEIEAALSGADRK